MALTKWIIWVGKQKSGRSVDARSACRSASASEGHKPLAPYYCIHSKCTGMKLHFGIRDRCGSPDMEFGWRVRGMQERSNVRDLLAWLLGCYHPRGMASCGEVGFATDKDSPIR